MKISLPTFLLVFAAVCATSVAGSERPAVDSTKSLEANKAIIQRLFKAFNEGDVAAINDISHSRGVIHTATGSTARDGTPRKTLAEACPMCANLHPRKITIDFIMAEGDLVTVRSTWRGKYAGTLRGTAIAGKDVQVYYTNTYRMKDGRIVENFAAYDRLHLLEQLGLEVAAARPTAAPTPPKGYTIAEIAVNDPVAYRDYVAAVTPLVPKFGGVYLVRGGQAEAKEGAAPEGRFVVIEFPSLAAAKAFYDSPEYQAVIGLRTRVAKSRVLQVEGAAP
jgi:uncharacterized protein (DUF1330 family)/predicted ester cyclase